MRCLDPLFFIGFPVLDYISRRPPRLALSWCPLLVPNFSANLVDLGQFGKVPPPSEIKDVLRLALRLALCILRRSILLYIYIITY